MTDAVVQERPRQQPEVETYVMPDGTCLLFDNRTEIGHVLNAVGALVWDYCDGGLTNDQISREIAELLPEQQFVPDQVDRLISELRDMELLQPTSIHTLIHAGARGASPLANTLDRS